MKNDITKIKELNMEQVQESFYEYIDCDLLTLKAYKTGIESFINYLHDNNIKHPTRLDFKAYRDELSYTKSTNTINSYMTAIRQLFKYLNEYGIYEDITRNVKSMKTSTIPKTQVISADKCKEIYNSLTDLREKLIFSLAITTGMRANEIANSKIENIKEYNGEIVLFHICKKRDDESEYNKLSSQVLEDIKNYIGNRTSGYIFTSTSNHNKDEGVTYATIRRIIKSIFKRFGIDENGISCHTLRRSCATIAYNNGADLVSIQQVLNQKSIQTTRKYLNQCTRDNNKLENQISNVIFG